MNTWQQTYEQWMNDANLDKTLRAELEQLTIEQQEEVFYKNLEFGTAGMRGELGVGTNRMNIYTIRKANEGFAQYIVSQGEQAKKQGIVIAYDSRYMSVEFAQESARMLASHGIHVYVFEALRATPELSFAVRHLQAFGGIVITASHNPKQYNGYKIYDATGCQFVPELAEQVVDFVRAVTDERALQPNSFEAYKEQGLITMIGESVDAAYNDAVVATSFAAVSREEICAVYTSLHGTGHIPVKRALDTLGYTGIHYVSEQCIPDPTFGTVPLPNPEDPQVFTLAEGVGKTVDADVLLATDPDADRLGIAVKDAQGGYTLLNGNVTGALMTYYLLSRQQEAGTLPDNGVIFTTVVTSDLATKIAASFGVVTEKTLTGFKFIGNKIAKYEQSKEKTFLFGFEESYGSLVNAAIARDKDAVQAVVILVEMAAYYKAQGKTLLDVLQTISEQFGFYAEALENINLSGKAGEAKIAHLIQTVAQHPFTTMSGEAVVTFENYLTRERISGNTREPIELPQADVLKFVLADGTWFCLRPSGTEPKAKVYISANGETAEAVAQKVATLRRDIMAAVEQILV